MPCRSLSEQSKAKPIKKKEEEKKKKKQTCEAHCDISTSVASNDSTLPKQDT